MSIRDNESPWCIPEDIIENMTAMKGTTLDQAIELLDEYINSDEFREYVYPSAESGILTTFGVGFTVDQSQAFLDILDKISITNDEGAIISARRCFVIEEIPRNTLVSIEYGLMGVVDFNTKCNSSYGQSILHDPEHSVYCYTFL